MRFIFRMGFGALLLSGTVLFGQTPNAQYEKYLLPTVIYQPIAGAHGAIWVTDLRITNSADHDVLAFWHAEGSGGVEPGTSAPTPLPSQTTIAPFTFADRGTQRGTFFFVERSYARQIQISIRVRDLSRQSQTWGTALPVVPEEAFTDAAVSLNDVPNDTVSRAIVRVYSLDGTIPTNVRLTVYGVRAGLGLNVVQDVLLGTRDYALSVTAPMITDLPAPFPGYVEIADLSALPGIAAFDRVRVDVRPLTPEARIWAFASITNNETQHVTIVAPSH